MGPISSSHCPLQGNDLMHLRRFAAGVRKLHVCLTRTKGKNAFRPMGITSALYHRA
jgi:hypothetical protein